MKKYTLLLVAILISFSTFSQEETKESKSVPRDPKKFESTHSGTFNGQKITYKAVVGETFLKNSKGEVTGALWSTSYIREGVDSSKRPVLFIFNGGPGSASIWLHVGFFGPKVVKTDSEAKADDGAAPYRFVENTQALLDITDLVFIDPIGTGWAPCLLHMVNYIIVPDDHLIVLEFDAWTMDASDKACALVDSCVAQVLATGWEFKIIPDERGGTLGYEAWEYSWAW